MPYALDIATLSQEKGMSIDEIISLHSAQTYKVYMLGFLPGLVFTYLTTKLSKKININLPLA
jgi:allophanate hydrolase subunit 1